MRKRKRKLRLHLSALPAPNATVVHVHVINVTAKAVVASRAVKVRSNSVHLVAIKPSPHWRSVQSMPPLPRKLKDKSAASVAAAVVDVIAASALSVPSVNHSNNRWRHKRARWKLKSLSLHHVQNAQSGAIVPSVPIANKVAIAVVASVRRVNLPPQPRLKPQQQLKLKPSCRTLKCRMNPS